MGVWRKKLPRQSAAADIEMNPDGDQTQAPVNTPNPRQARRRCLNVTDAFRKFFSGECGGFTVLVALFLTIEVTFFLFNYFDMYSDVYPGSKVAQNLSGGKGVAFVIFMYLICGVSVNLTCPAGVYLAGAGIGACNKAAGACIAAFIALPWIGLCLFLGTWQLWISWAIEPVWHDMVYNNACHELGWSGYALLQGINFRDVSASLPMVGTATVVLTTGNYTMQLERADHKSYIYYFYPIDQNDVNPFYSNITYNTFNSTYTVNNHTARWVVSPNLAFPSLDLSLDDPSIPFGDECDTPSANLVYKNGSMISNVFNTVTTAPNHCELLKACININQQSKVEIAMGVVM